MKSSFKGILLMIVVLSGAFFGGCANSQKGLNKSSTLFECLPSEGVILSGLRAYEEDDEFIVQGKIKRAFNNCCDTTRGHIDIAVMAPDGSVLDFVNARYMPRDIPRVRSRASHFTVKLPYTLTEEMSLRVSYHHNELEIAASGEYGGNNHSCEQNMSL